MEENKNAENNYANNQEDPKPSKEALEERDDKPASKLLNWIIVITVVVLTIIVFLFYY